MSREDVESVLGSLHLATQAAPHWGKAWHHWALFNVDIMDHNDKDNISNQHVAMAVQGFFRSVALGQASGESPCKF